MSKKILSDLLYYFLDISYISLIGYLFFIILGKMLAPSDYGILMTVLALLNILLPITTLGFNEAIVKFIPSFTNREKNMIGRYIKYVYKYGILFSLVLSAIIFFFSKEIAILFYSNESLSLPFKILSVLLVLGSITLITKGVLQGFKLFKKIFTFDIIPNLLRLIVPVLLIYYFGMGVVGGLMGWGVYFLLFVLISTPFIINNLSKGGGVVKNDIWKYGISSALSASGFTLLLQTGVLLLSFYNFEVAGLFAVAMIFGQLVLFLPMIVSGVILPYVSELFSKNNIKEGKKIIELSLKNLFLFLFPILFIIIFFSRTIIVHLYSIEYVGASIFILPFILGSFLLGLTMVLLTVLYATGYPITKLKITWFMVLLNIILSLLLIGIFGNVGVAYGFLISQVISLLLISLIVRKKIKLSLPVGINKIITTCIIFIILNFLINKFYINFYISLSLLITSLLIYFYLILKFEIFGAEEKELFYNVKNKILNKLKR